MQLAWQTYQHIFFDCDSTLTKIEGIDELARAKGKEQRIGLLTNKAMDGQLDLAEVYGKRLRAINPTRAQLKAVEERYWQETVEDAAALIAALHYLGKRVYIISGGLLDAVRGFSRRLGVPPERVRAVELEYNQLSGRWWDYHEPQAQQAQSYLDYDQGPLTLSSGKSSIIRELLDDAPGRRMMVGDGASDLAAKDAVDSFVGYGGVVARTAVRAESDLFIRCESLSPLLPLSAGPRGWKSLQGSAHEALFRKGLRLAQDPSCLTFRHPAQKQQFSRAMQACDL